MMLPSESELMFCVMRDGVILEGAHGLAIGNTEDEAWERAVEPNEDWARQRLIDSGDVVRRCAIMVINP